MVQALLHPASPTPASEAVVISIEDPQIVVIRKVTSAAETLRGLSASPALVILSPDKQACAAEKDPTA